MCDRWEIRRCGRKWIVSDRERGSSHDTHFNDLRAATEEFIRLCEQRWQPIDREPDGE
jgi:hypothetical protein